MRRILVYSHDTFGLGNIRRMLTICEYLVTAIPDVSILLITGSPVIHSFRLPPRLDYIKIPTLTRKERDEYAAKYLGTAIGETIQLRSNLILQAAKTFQPDMILVDKKPLGVKHELQATLHYMQTHHPMTKMVLILRDILDSPEATIATWKKHDYTATIESFYHRVLLLGSPDIFDAVREYAFPATVARKARWTGYLRRAPSTQSPETTRHRLGVAADEKLVVITPGGGQDGAYLLRTCIASIALAAVPYVAHYLIITGPEMNAEERDDLFRACAACPHVRVVEFTDDLMSYLQAADVVVAMGGYNTICEILSAGKPAVIVPRDRPVEEQLIRANHMSARGLFNTINPDDLTPERLHAAIRAELDGTAAQIRQPQPLDLDGLPRIAEAIQDLLASDTTTLVHHAATVDGFNIRVAGIRDAIAILAVAMLTLMRGMRLARSSARPRNGGWL